ncbi:MAG: TonB family protein [Polyangiales bacterium]
MRTVSLLAALTLVGPSLGCSSAPTAPTAAAPRAATTGSEARAAPAVARAPAPVPSWAHDDVRSVDQALAEHRSRLDACARLGASTPAGSTEVVLDVRVAPTGRVKAARPTGAVPSNTRIARCLASRVRALSLAHGAPAELHLLVPFRVGPGGLVVLPAERAPSEHAAGEPSHQPDLVRATMAERRPAVQRCYERVLRNRPELRGTVTVEFTIHEGGRVGRVAIAENTTRHPGLATCIKQVVGRFRFSPAPVGGSVTYRYPYQFRPVG